MIDAKFALDEDLAGIDEAIDADDPERLVAYGRKLRARAEDLAKRDYAKVADRGTAIVLLYVPVEGAYEALRVLPNFSIEKFSQRHRVYVVTPSQLGLALGFVAEVAHERAASEETEQVATGAARRRRGHGEHGRPARPARQAPADRVHELRQAGRDDGTRGKLWRRMSTVFEFARRRPAPTARSARSIRPARTPGEIAERWREAAGE